METLLYFIVFGAAAVCVVAVTAMIFQLPRSDK